MSRLEKCVVGTFVFGVVGVKRRICSCMCASVVGVAKLMMPGGHCWPNFFAAVCCAG